VRRRDLLAGVGSLAVLGGGATFALSSSSGEQVDPVPVQRLGDDGQNVDAMQVPQTGQPTLLTMFATWCPDCRATMPELVSVHEERQSAQFVSVTNEAVGQTTTQQDVADWWDRHGGDWPVAIDADLELTAALDVRSVPHTFVFDSDNTIVYDNQGRKSAAELRDALKQA
jgi:thiol-disulfide isomerase/thioredoxin